MAQGRLLLFPGAMAALMREPRTAHAAAVVARRDPKLALLARAKEHVSDPWPGGPGRPGRRGLPPYRRSGLFRSSLRLDVVGARLVFSSDAVRRGHPYGHNLINGGPPYKGPYRMLPRSFYYYRPSLRL